MLVLFVRFDVSGYLGLRDFNIVTNVFVVLHPRSLVYFKGVIQWLPPWSKPTRLCEIVLSKSGFRLWSRCESKAFKQARISELMVSARETCHIQGNAVVDRRLPVKLSDELEDLWFYLYYVKRAIYCNLTKPARAWKFSSPMSSTWSNLFQLTGGDAGY